MSALDHIEIRGFKSIRETSLDLGPLNVLIGANGAGKSNFISVFKLLNQIVQENLQEFVAVNGGGESFLHFGQKVTSKIELELQFGQNGYNVTLIPTSNDAMIFSKENCWYMYPNTGIKHDINLGIGHKETGLIEEARDANARIAKYVLTNLRSWKLYHFHDTSDSAKIKKTGDINDNTILRPDASNLAAFLFLLREKHLEHYVQIVNTIRLAAPFFDDFVLRPAPLNPEKIQLEWRQEGTDSYFNASALSDGTLRFMCLATLLLQPNPPSTILIDEPELGLHPYAITLLANLLESAATRRQVIVSTQSVPLVNQFSPEEIIVVDLKAGESHFRRLASTEIADWLEDYGLGELWEKNVLGGRPQR